MTSKKQLVVLISVLLFLLGAGVAAYVGYPSSSDSFSYQDVEYKCSEKIKGKIGIRGFEPTNDQQFKKYCREYYEFEGFGPPDCINCEYRAVLDILKRADVSRVIGKYDTTLAWVKALHHNYIQDKDYLNRILPAYSNMKIDCIIVVHSPEGTRFFIENGEKHDSHKDHQYIEIPATEVLASLNNAPDSDVTNFWLGLR